MFTGLIEKTAKVLDFSLSQNGAVLSIEKVFDEVKIGESVAINGVCLTITQMDNVLKFDCMKETLTHSNLKTLKKGNVVNLERAMKISNRLDGHIVTGHIDTTAQLEKIILDGFSKRLKFCCDTSMIVLKGSIAVNGVSLTVSGVDKNSFEVSLIPQTQNDTNLDNLKIGDIVNIEYDILAKYIDKMLKNYDIKPQKKEITLEFLKQNGF